MANLFAGRRTLIVAKETKAISATTIGPGNTEIMYFYDPAGGVYSYKPGRPTNGLNQVVKNQGYLIQGKDGIPDTDLPDFYPPFPEAGSVTGTILVAEDGTTPIGPEEAV